MESPKIYFRRLRTLAATVALIMSLFVACDVLENDVSPENPTVEFNGTEVYAITGNSAFIDLRGKIKSTEAVQLTITSQPRRGKLSDLKNGLLQYTPYSDFKSGRDGFQFSIYSLDNKLLLQDTVLIIVSGDTTNLPCGIYPVNDYVIDSTESAITVPVLNNDVICNVDSADIRLEVYLAPYKGTAAVVGNRYIRYTPASGFEGRDTVMYKVSSRRDTTKAGYGVLVIAVQSDTTTTNPTDPTDPTGPQPIPGCEWSLVDDLFTINRSVDQDTVFLPIFKNDTLCSDLLSKYVVSIVKAPNKGAIQLNGLSAPRYGITLPDGSPSKTDTLIYRICADTVCKQARTIIKINP